MHVIRTHIEVAAGVVRDQDRGRVLLARRPEGVHQGGLWEFPGGKLEPDETVSEALKRELSEEIGIIVHASIPLITLEHSYPDRTVRLHVREVRDFSGEPRGLEGQPVKWVSPGDLDQYSFPAANYPIKTAVQLPDRYPILNLDDHSPRVIQGLLAAWSDQGLRLIRLRTIFGGKALDRVGHWVAVARTLGIEVLIDGPPELVDATDAAGLHLRALALGGLKERPLRKGRWLSASCHDGNELLKAMDLGVDFAVLGPVLPTASHPGAPAMGWSHFESLVSKVSFPVYALGGLESHDILVAREHGAQGIAAIRAFLPNSHGLGA